MINEIDIIRDLKNIFPKIGNDAADFKLSGDKIPIACIDSYYEGVHFEFSYCPRDVVGYRSVAATLSDIAAVGGVPRYIAVSVGLSSPRFYKEIIEGIKEACDKFGVEVIGGDTIESPHTFLTICAIGEAERVVPRQGAEAGDLICVTGTIGDAAINFSYLKSGFKLGNKNNKFFYPEPRIKEGQKLSPYVTSMIDISDGLIIDLWRLLYEGKLGAQIDIKNIPIKEESIKLCEEMGRDYLNFQLYGGEDYELLFTIKEENLPKIRDVDFRVIGRVIDKKGFFTKKWQKIHVRGYVHFKSVR